MDLETGIDTDFDFPPLPQTLGEVLALISEDAREVTAERLIEIIERDPAMTAYVIRQANSSYYAVRQYIARVDRAVTFLGFATVSRIALSAALREAFSYLEEPSTRHIYAYIMEKSLAAGLFARELTLHCRLSVTHTTFTAGMLHQLGRLVLLHSRKEPYVPLWQCPPESKRDGPAPPDLETERERLETDYAEIGGLMAERWNMPEELATVIRFHREPEQIRKPHIRLFGYIIQAAAGAAELPEPESGSSLERLSDPERSPLAGLARFRNEPLEGMAGFVQAIGPRIRELAAGVLD